VPANAKFTIKKRRLNFMKAWASTEGQMINELANEEEEEEVEDSLTQILGKRVKKAERMSLSEISDEGDTDDGDSTD
jgi:hypothetical protein